MMSQMVDGNMDAAMLNAMGNPSMSPISSVNDTSMMDPSMSPMMSEAGMLGMG